MRLEQGEVCSLQSLSDEERARYVPWWRQVQRNAARQPAIALLQADELLTELLADAGYPTGGFLQHAEDVSADHAGVVDDYRAARNVVLDMRLGLAGKAEIRDAMLRYRRVFERLLDAEATDEADETAACPLRGRAAGTRVRAGGPVAAHSGGIVSGPPCAAAGSRRGARAPSLLESSGRVGEKSRKWRDGQWQH